MTSEEDTSPWGKVAAMPNTSDSSGGENEYDDASYGSSFQPPGLSQDFVMVHESCCRARYRPSRMAKDAPFYICLNRSTCRSLAGGQHPVLRGKHRSQSGVYEGIFGSNGKLLAAKSGTLTTSDSQKQMAEASRAADRAQAEAIIGLSTDVLPSDELLASNFSIPQAENLVSSEIDQEVEETTPGTSADKNAMFLGLFSSLVT